MHVRAQRTHAYNIMVTKDNVLNGKEENQSNRRNAN